MSRSLAAAALVALAACASAGPSLQENSTAAPGISCGDGDPRVTNDRFIREDPGGPAEPQDAIDRWARQESQGKLTAADFQPSQSQPAAGVTSLASPGTDTEVVFDHLRGDAVVMRATVGFAGDSWHVMGWQACESARSQLFGTKGGAE